MNKIQAAIYGRLLRLKVWVEKGYFGSVVKERHQKKVKN